MPPLTACAACEELIAVGTCVCPHCGAHGACKTAGLSKAALLLGLTVGAAGCFHTQADYAAPDFEETGQVDNDGDGWEIIEGDCDDDDPDIHPDAEETPGDGVDSNCDGDDDT